MCARMRVGVCVYVRAWVCVYVPVSACVKVLVNEKGTEKSEEREWERMGTGKLFLERMCVCEQECYFGC